jgi:hypothetical protein
VRTLSACALAIGLSVLPISAQAAAPPQTAAPESAATSSESEAEPVVVPPPPTTIEVDPRNYRMVLAGNIVIGLSGAGMIAMAVGLGIRSDAMTQRQALTVSDQPDLDAIARQARRIETGTQLAITGGAAAAVLLASGITLVAVGYRRERLRRLSLPTASFGPHGASVSWTLRF